MRWKTAKTLSTLLTLTLLIGSVPIFHNATAQNKPKIYVDPAENIFHTDETPVGATFDISVKTADFPPPGVYSYEFKMYYDTSMLVATVAVIPEGHWLTPSLSPGNIFKVDPGTINTHDGYVSFAVTLLGTEPGKTGSGTLALVTFKITSAPPGSISLSSQIELKDVTLVDPDAVPIPAANFNVVPATFTYAAPPPPWYLKIEPETTPFYKLEDEAEITVSIHDAKAEAKITGIQFKIVLPETLWTQKEWIHSALPSEVAYFEAIVEKDAEGHLVVIAFILLLPNPNGIQDLFFDGNVPLAYVELNVTSLPENVTKLPLCLSDVLMVDFPDLNSVPFRNSECAAVIAPPKPEDLNLDLKVNIQDVVIFAVAFGSTPISPRWNPKADLNYDEKVNILDGVMIAKAYGWTLPDPP